jgi:hypothetical protein
MLTGLGLGAPGEESSGSGPGGGVTSVNGDTGPAVGLNAADVGAEPSLGFTPENVANKATDFSTVNNTKYPSVQAVKNQIEDTAFLYALMFGA